jgi:hypothetical protein
VAVHQGLLHRVQQAGQTQPAQAVQVFNREQRLAVQAGHELNAGVHRPQAELTVHLFSENHGAGTAVAFGTALLGAAGMNVLTQVLEHRAGRRHAVQLPDGAAEMEMDGAFAHGSGSLAPTCRDGFKLTHGVDSCCR